MSSLLRIGKSLLHGDIDAITKSTGGYSLPIDPSTYRTPDGENWVASFLGDQTSYFKYENESSCVKAYTRCAPMNAIINKKAQAYINGKTWILDDKGAETDGLYAKQLRKLLKKPNPLQSWDQFEAQMYIYVAVFGYCPTLAIKPAGYKENIYATSLWNLPPTHVKFNKTGKLYNQKDVTEIISSITFTYDGTPVTLKTYDVCIIKDITPDFCSHMPLLPESRIKALQMPINNTMGAYESRNVLINYRGALGIFSKDVGGSNGGMPAPPITLEEKTRLQQDFKRYGLKNNQWQFILTSAAIKWQSVSVPTKDLLLFEEVQAGTMAMCDSYSFPFQLLSEPKGTTFSNQQEAKKLLYQDAILPEAKSIYGQLNNFFETEKYGIQLDKDYSQVPVLQEDQLQLVTARKMRNDALAIEWDHDLITLNQWRVANGNDPLPGGDLLKSQMPTTSGPLATLLGVGGIQALIAVQTAPGLSPEARQATLEIVFGLTPEQAGRMSVAPAQTENNGQ